MEPAATHEAPPLGEPVRDRPERREGRSGFRSRDRGGRWEGPPWRGHREGPFGFRGRGPRDRFGGPPWGRGGWEGGEGGPGSPEGLPWGRRGGPRVGRGDVRSAILMLLAEQPLHGYQIIQEIAKRSGGIWQPSPGSVYPALQLLEDEGLVRVEQAEGRRVYHLTEAGRAYVEERREQFANAWETVTGSADDQVLELRDLIAQVGAALKQVAKVGTEAQIREARELLVSTRRKLYRILAEDDAEGETVRA